MPRPLPPRYSQDAILVAHELRGIKHALFIIAEFLLTQPTQAEIPAEFGAQIDALKTKLKTSGDALNAAVEDGTPSET